MKNIETILAEAGIELTDEQKQKITDGVKENYKPVADWQKQVDKVKNLEDTVKETQEALDKFKDVDADKLKQTIDDLNKQIADNQALFDKEIADRDFNDIIDKAIADAKGKNVKAIRALLDMEILKSSKNQKDDIDKALAELAGADDSKMLFGEAEPQKVGAGNPIGTVKKTPEQTTESLGSALREHYTK